MKLKLSKTHILGIPGLLAAAVFLLDQLTKVLVMHFYPRTGVVYHEIIPGFFSLVHFRNTGAAWGMFSQHTWVLGLISAAALLLIIFYFDRITEKNPVIAWIYGLLLGGIAGNLYDRWFRGSVVDFLFFYWKDFQHAWPAFNVADSFICVSVIFLVVYAFFFTDGKKQSSGDGTERPQK